MRSGPALLVAVLSMAGCAAAPVARSGPPPGPPPTPDDLAARPDPSHDAEGLARARAQELTVEEQTAGVEPALVALHEQERDHLVRCISSPSSTHGDPVERRRLALRAVEEAAARARTLLADPAARALSAASLERLVAARVEETRRLLQDAPDPGRTLEDLDARLRSFVEAELEWVSAVDATERRPRRKVGIVAGGGEEHQTTRPADDPEEPARVAVREAARQRAAACGSSPATAEAHALAAARAWDDGAAERRREREEYDRAVAERERAEREQDEDSEARDRRSDQLGDSLLGLFHRAYDAARDLGDAGQSLGRLLTPPPRLTPPPDMPERASLARIASDRRPWRAPGWTWPERHRALTVTLVVREVSPAVLADAIEAGALEALAEAGLQPSGDARGPAVALTLSGEVVFPPGADARSAGRVEVQPLGAIWPTYPRYELAEGPRSARPWRFGTDDARPRTDEVEAAMAREASALGRALVEVWLRTLVPAPHVSR